MKKFLQLKSLLAIVLFAVGIGVSYADTYSYTFEATQFTASGESVALGDATWTLTADTEYWGFDSNNGKGQQIGSAGKPATTATLTTSDFANAEITSITVNTSGASSVVAEFAIKVGGTQWGETTTLTKTATDYTFTGSGKGDVAIEWTNSSAKALYIKSITIEYTTTSTSSVATPTFTVEPDTYGTKQSVGIECATDGAVIYYTLDGNTPDKTSTLYEAPIELNSKTTVKAIAYVDEEASNVATATYDFKLDCVLTWNTNSPFIQATTGSAKTQFVSPLGNTGANYWVTYDGSEPSAENGTKKYPANSLMMSTIKKDTIFTMKVRPEKDGIYGETLEGTFYIGYQSSLTLYKTVSEMAAGNYVIAGENTVMLPVDGGKNTYGYGYTADAAVSNGLVSAFGYFEFAFEAADGGYYIKDSKGQYLYGDGEHTSFQLSTTVPTSGGVWSVELQANGQAKITNATTGDWIQWNSNYKNWAMYNKEQNTFMPTLAVAYQPTVTITPAANNSVESLDKIILTCSDGIKNNKTHYCSVQGAGVTVNVTANQVDDNTLELVLDSPITKSGDYTFIFYKEAVILAPNSAAIKYPAVTENINYTIGGGAEPIELVVTPANESVNKSLQNFTFSYEQGISINGLFGGQAPFLGFTDPTTGTSSQIALTPGASTETSVTLSTEKAQTTEGYYTLVVPAEYFVLADAQPNEAIMYQYIVSATNPNAINIKSVTPEEGNVTELKQIIVMCDVEIDLAPSTWTITDAKGNVYPAQYTSPSNLGYMGIQIDLKETITAEGTYTLNIPAGSIVEYLGSKQIEEQTITWTIGGTVETPDYIFNAGDHVEGEYETLTDGIYTFFMGEGSTKKWKVEANEKKFSNGVTITNRIKPQKLTNYITADIPAAGKLVFGVLTSSSSATDRTLSVKQNDKELYGKVVSEADKVDGVYTVHEVEVEAGLATITTPVECLNFYYIEFVPAGDAPATIEFLGVNPEEGVVTSLKEIRIETDTDLGEARDFTLTDADGNSYEIFSVTVNPYDKDIYAYITVQLAEEITAAGTYTLTIPAGKVVEYITDMETQTPKLNAEKTYTWTIEANDALAIVSTTPADGETVASFTEMVVEFNKEIWIGNAFTGASAFVVKDANGETVTSCLTEILDPIGSHPAGFGTVQTGTKVRIYADEEITTAGNYQLIVPANTVKTADDTEVFPETAINFTVGTAITATWSIEEYATIESFTDVTVTFAGEGIESVKATNSYACVWFYEKDAEGNYNLVTNQCTDGYLDATASGTSLTLGADPGCYSDDWTSPFNRKGDYRIVIPAGGIYFNGDKANANTEEYVLNFTIYNDIVELDEIDATFTANPENNSTISEIKEVVITFPEYEVIAVSEPDFATGSNIPMVSMVDELTGSAMPAGYIMFRPGDALNQLVLYVDPTYTGGMESFAAEGQYVINIPAKVVSFSNGVNKAFQLNYTVGSTVEELAIVSTTPEENAMTESFSEMIIEFNKPVWCNTGVAGKASLKDGEGFPVADLEVEMIDPVGEHTTWNGSSPLATKARLYLSEAITETGSYQVVLPAELFSTDDMSESTAKTTIKFSVVAPALAVVASTPAEGEEVESFSEMVVEFNKPVWFTSFGNAKLYDAEGTAVATLSHEMVDPVGNHTTWNGSTPLAHKVRFYTDNAITADGNYSVVIAKETFATDDASEYSEKTTINFTVKYVAPSTLELVATDPAEGATITATAFESVLTTWNMDVDNAYEGAEAYLLDAEGNRVATANAAYVYDENHVCIDDQLNFVFNTPITNAMGTYTFVIEAGYVSDMATYTLRNEEIRITYNLAITDGIKGITMDPVNGYVVYDFNGVLVMQTRNAADLERLNNGLYIINGVKVLINK